MGQQVSIEVAFEGYREKATELFHENVLLKAHTKTLETEIEQLRKAGSADSPAPPEPLTEAHVSGRPS
jgi:hypothetical protein